MRCLLFGHTWQRFAGHGEYAGHDFLVCTECGRTLPATATEENEAMIAAQEQEADAS